MAPLDIGRWRGALLGLAVGDAVGTTVEFKPPVPFPPVTGMVGGGPFDLPAGAWTDDNLDGAVPSRTTGMAVSRRRSPIRSCAARSSGASASSFPCAEPRAMRDRLLGQEYDDRRSQSDDSAERGVVVPGPRPSRR